MAILRKPAAIALIEIPDLDARTIAEKALNIAGDICVFTNHHHTIEELEIPQELIANPSIKQCD